MDPPLLEDRHARPRRLHLHHPFALEAPEGAAQKRELARVAAGQGSLSRSVGVNGRLSCVGRGLSGAGFAKRVHWPFFFVESPPSLLGGAGAGECYDSLSKVSICQLHCGRSLFVNSFAPAFPVARALSSPVGKSGHPKVGFGSHGPETAAARGGHTRQQPPRGAGHGLVQVCSPPE